MSAGPTPLVLLHGFTGDGRAFADLSPLLEGRAVVTPDLPGHGASPPLSVSGRAGFVATLEIIAEVVRASGHAQVDLHGYSMGARLALAFALRYPEKVRRLVLESGSPGLRTRRQRLNRRRSDERLAARIEREGVESFTQRWEQLPLFAGLRALSPLRTSAVRARRSGQSAAGLAWSLRALGTGVQPSAWARLPRLQLPVLVMAGERDMKFTRIARAMAARLPHATLRVLPGVFHVPHLEAPQAWASEMRAFLG